MNTGPSNEKSGDLVFPGRALMRELLGPVYRPLRRVGRFLTWVIPSLGGLLSTPPSGRRVLLIYDTCSQPFNIGDILIMQEGSLVLRARHGIDLVDFAIVYDPKYPAA